MRVSVTQWGEVSVHTEEEVLVWGDTVSTGEKSIQRGDAPVWAAQVQ